MYVILDGDILLYKTAFSCVDYCTLTNYETNEEVHCEHIREQEAYIEIDDALERSYSLVNSGAYDSSKVILILSLKSKQNYRYSIFSDYKGNRKDKEKPTLYHPLRDYMLKNHNVLSCIGLEADDVMGLLGSVLADVVVMSIDKDMKTVPNIALFNPKTTSVDIIEPKDAYYNLLVQSVTGDRTDNYTGIPGVGIKKAEKLLKPIYDSCATAEEFYGKGLKAVISSYKDKGLTEDDALRNLKLAQIMSRDNIIGEASELFDSEGFNLKFNLPPGFPDSYYTFPISMLRLESNK